MIFRKFLYIVNLFNILSLNFSEAKIVCYNEMWNNMVRDDYQAWCQRPFSLSSSAEERTIFQNNPALAYCEYLSQRSQNRIYTDETRLKANKLLTLIYEIGAYFGLEEASAKEEFIAKRHLKAIAQNLFQIDQSRKFASSNPSSEVLQIINSQVNDDGRRSIQNPNTSILMEYIKEENQTKVKKMMDDINKTPSYNSLRSEFQTWIRFLAGDTTGKIKISSTDRDIYAVRQLSNEKLENYHDYIQLLFPNSHRGVINLYYLDQPNNLFSFQSSLDMNPLQGYFADLYQTSEKFRNLYILNLKLSFFCMMRFYGLTTEYSSDSDSIYQGTSTFTWKLKKEDHSFSKITKWAGNHNCLRLTRILMALKMARIDDLANMLYTALQIYGESGNSYWKHAAQDENYSNVILLNQFRRYSYPKKGLTA